MDKNNNSEIEPTTNEITQIGNENEKIVIAIEGDDNNTVTIPKTGDESPKETELINADLEKLKNQFSYFCDNCCGYTVFDSGDVWKNVRYNGFARCAHCGNNEILDEIDLDYSDDLDIIIPEKPFIPLGKFNIGMSGDLFKAFVGNLKGISDEHKISISPDKIHIQSVDHAHVVMLALDLPRWAMVRYEADTLQIGIDTEKLIELSKMCKKDSVVYMDLSQESNKLNYKLGFVSGDMAIVDTKGLSDPKIPNVTLPCHFDVSIKDMLDIIKRASTIADHITIFADKDKVIITANGETDNTKMVLTNNQEIHYLEIKDNENVRSLFSLDYVSNIFKSLKPCAKTCTIFMGTDYPLKVTTSLYNGEGEITYLLAPRIEND